MQNKYFVESNLDKYKLYGYTFFLDGNDIKQVASKLKNYNIYEPFIDCDYKMIYKDKIPNVKCFKIITKNILKHSDIMGALYNLNINDSLFGDIIVGDEYYFLVLDEIAEYIKNNLLQIGKYKVFLEESELPITSREYQIINIIASSNRIDTVISKLTNLNRKDVNSLLNKKEIILNYEILVNNSYQLKENDTFSIRRYGKYKYVGITKTTKKNNFVIEIKKYI